MFNVETINRKKRNHREQQRYNTGLLNKVPCTPLVGMHHAEKSPEEPVHTVMVYTRKFSCLRRTKLGEADCYVGLC